MCGGGGGGGSSAAAQQRSLELQEEQMAMQRQQFEEQMALQREQMAEQKRIAEAPPPPPPAPSAMSAASAAETVPSEAAADMAIPLRRGLGRRQLRTDIAGGAGGLSIPAV